MMLVNGTSRYHVAIQALKGAAKRNEKVRLRLHELTSELTGRISEVTKFILAEKTGKLDSTMLTPQNAGRSRISRNLG
jgi:xylulose-5-phosphate/fructose-6-phosphate phosphoketolase